jgi:flagellin
MSLSINTNSSASAAASNLSTTNASLQRSLQRLSSGSRIVNSSDDAGGLAVSMKMGAAIRRTEATNTNVANAQSFLKTQDGAFQTVGKVLERMSELATLSQDVTKTSTDTAAYNLEFQQLKSQIMSLSANSFNGVSLFGGTSAATLSVAIVEDASQSTTVTQAALTGGTAMTTLLAASSEISSMAGAQSMGSQIRSAIIDLGTMRATNGSEASRLGFAAEMLTINKNNLESANSRIVDVDVAAESTQLARFNILQQAGTAMLSQANQSTQSILRLLS